MADTFHVENPLMTDEMNAAFALFDNILLKKYITGLDDVPCIVEPNYLKSMSVGENVSLYRIANIVYDKHENVQDKLTTIYSTILALRNYGLVLLIKGYEDHVDLFIGVVSREIIDEDKLIKNGNALKNVLIGNFPGTELIAVNNMATDEISKNRVDSLGKAQIIEEVLEDAKYISAVSSIPAVRNANNTKNDEFTQGLEKFIDTMMGKKYSAIIIADAVDNDKIDQMCAKYEEIYSQLAPFKASSLTIGRQEGSTDTKGFVKGDTKTKNKMTTHSSTEGTSTSKSNSNSIGISIGLSFTHTSSKPKTDNESETDSKSKGKAKSVTKQKSESKATSKSDSESIQINYENRRVKTLLDRIDEQIKRMRSCEDFGMFDVCTYFAAEDRDVAVAAASAFKSLTRGVNSSVESSAINVWEKDNAEKIKDYLRRFYHPEFSTVLDDQHKYQTTAAMLISGREMAYQMPLPKRSVPGIPVVDCAEFGREVVSLGDVNGDLELGNIYHMHREEQSKVMLNANSLTAHTFITGSTGSGKSTTVYKLINELSDLPIDDSDETVKFMVIEPAKGEYKDHLATDEKFEMDVYGTNPDLTKLLSINPFRFRNDKIHIYEHLDRLIEIFNVCWPMYAAMPAVLKAAMENAYRAAGWDLKNNKNKYGDMFPNFVDVALEVEKYINKSEYSEDSKSDYKGSLLTRLESLTNGINSLIFSADDIDDADLFDKNVIIDLSRVGSPETKALIMGILILKLQEYRVATSDKANSDLRHITVLEEAHNLLKRTSTEQTSETANLLGKSVEMLANSIAEMRTYGEGFIIADQSPGLLDMSVIRNTNTKIIMRLPDFSDRELVGKAAGLNDEQIVELAKLPCGVAAVYQNDWASPVLCKVQKPKLKEGKFSVQCDDCQSECADALLFEVLDKSFTDKLGDMSEVEAFKDAVIKAAIPAEAKIKLLDYISTDKTAKNCALLSSAMFDCFKNAKETLENTLEDVSVEEIKTAVKAELSPSIKQYDDEQIDLLITLFMDEYNRRYGTEYPVWNEFASKFYNGEIL